MDPAKIIYLQFYEPEGDGTVTWCESKIHENDVVYVQAEPVRALLNKINSFLVRDGIHGDGPELRQKVKEVIKTIREA